VVHWSAPARLKTWRADGSTAEHVHGVDFDLYGVPRGGRLALRRVGEGAAMPDRPDAEVALFLDGSSSDRRRWLGDARGAGFGLLLAPGSEQSDAAPTTPRGGFLVGEPAEQPPGTLRPRGTLLAALRRGEIAALELADVPSPAPAPAANVVGVIRGAAADPPERARATLVLSAHYDHLRPLARPAVPGGDVIMNGADDDASGCAAVLELAEALAAGPPPARTIVFLFATGEEYGLLGTDWYVAHPLVPLADTVCNLNFEMLGRADPLAGGPGKLWLAGDERSNLGDAFRALGVPVVADPRPQERFFERSDNIAFARRGIVAQTLSSFNLHTDYHGPDDELERIELAHMEAALRAVLPGVRALADGSLAPAWKPGGDPSRRW
jgi:hypothetical protein